MASQPELEQDKPAAATRQELIADIKTYLTILRKPKKKQQVEAQN